MTIIEFIASCLIFFTWLLATPLLVNMKREMTADYTSLIRALRVEKGWGALRMMTEFPKRKLTTVSEEYCRR